MINKWTVPILSTIMGLAVSFYFFNDLPDSMAIHFSINDEPDRFVSKTFGAFILPLITFAVIALTQLSSKLEQNEQKKQRFEKANGLVNAIISVVILCAHLFTLAFNLGYEINASYFAPLLLGLTFIAVGNIVPTMPQATTKIFRLDDEVYRPFARIVGRIMVVIGFIAILSVLLPRPFNIYIMFGLIAFFVLFTFVLQMKFLKKNKAK